MKLYRGYIPIVDKTPIIKWKRETVPDECLLTLEQADTYAEYGAVLTEDVVMVDIDERNPAEKLLAIVKDEELKCRVVDTDRGLHFIFNNKDGRFKKSGSHLRFAVGIAGDIKVGSSNSYEKLKSHGKVRPCIYGEELTDTDQLDPAPVWLKTIGKQAETVDFVGMADGSGRNDALYRHSYSLQRRGFSSEDALKTCELLNAYVFDDPLSDEELRQTVLRDEAMKVKPTFDTSEVEEDRRELAEGLEFAQSGKLKNKSENVLKLLNMDPGFDGIRKNLLSGAIEAGDLLPWTRDQSKKDWTDEDDAALRIYLEKWFDNLPAKKALDALITLAEGRQYHPVRDYLNSLPAWDGIKRVDDLFVDFLGADDTEYVHQVTRKTLCAAIKRVMEPGCKFDTMLVLNGRQGIGKSTLISRLGMAWFSDALRLTDLATKECIEKIQGQWIIEIGELAGMKKIDIESLRSYLSRTDDYGRKAYGRNAEHRPRQCVFFGTTNAQEDGFLRDIQGNRRFWIIDLPDDGGERSCIGDSADLEQWEVDQIWAEAMTYVETEKLYLTGSVAQEAERIQSRSIEADPREGIVAEYLDTLLPESWYTKTPEERLSYLKFDNPDEPVGTKQRQFVTNAEIWVEALGGKLGNVKSEAYSIAAIMKRMPGWHRGKGVKRIKGYGPSGYYERDQVSDKRFY